MKALGIIFPDQLSINNKVLQKIGSKDVLLLYEPVDTFYQIRHHKQKIAFPFSMRNRKGQGRQMINQHEQK